MTQSKLLDELTANILRQSPDLQDAWQNHLEYWEGEERHPYIDLGELAELAVEEFATGNPSPLKVACDLLEPILASNNKPLIIDVRSSYIDTLHTRFVTHTAQLDWSNAASHLGPRMTDEIIRQDLRWQGASSLKKQRPDPGI